MCGRRVRAAHQHDWTSSRLHLALIYFAVLLAGCISVTLIEEGKLTATRAEAISARTGGDGIVEGATYSACALSFVLHAKSPMVPTLRGDVRVFAVAGQQWYGGGLDLTPSYVVEDDCVHFHSKLAELCARHSPHAATYKEMKKTCDDYFFLP